MMGLEEIARDRSQEPLTTEQIDILAELVMRAIAPPLNKLPELRTGEAMAALGALRRIVEQAKRRV